MLKRSTMQNKQYSFVEKKHGPEKSYFSHQFFKELMPDSFKGNA